MTVHYDPPDISKIEKFLKKFVFKEEDKKEERVIQRYIQLAGLVQGGEMVNKDKEARARAWVKEQEEKEEAMRRLKKWWERTFVQLIMFIGAMAGIISLFLYFK